MQLKPIENIMADIRDIMDVMRKIANRHLESIRSLIGRR